MFHERNSVTSDDSINPAGFGDHADNSMVHTDDFIRQARMFAQKGGAETSEGGIFPPFGPRELHIVEEMQLWATIMDRQNINIEFYDGYVFHEAAGYLQYLIETIERMILKIEKGLHWSAQIEGKDALKAIQDAVQPEMAQSDE